MVSKVLTGNACGGRRYDFLDAGTAGRLVRALACGLLLLLVIGDGACRREPKTPPQPYRPNVVLITIDTLRADRVGAGGSAGLTPAIDALGRAGTVFTDATAHAPLTLPSHASILTGRYPASHGVHDNAGFQLSPSIPTLASVFHDAGYRTAAFVSSYVLRSATGLARGFDLYDDRFVQTGRARVTTATLERRGSETARAAAAWLAATPDPYFAWVHLYDPHAPYNPPPAFAARFPGHPYDGEVAAADFAVSQVLAAIPRRERTVIVVTGDHGESLGEHGEPEHGVLVYDSTLHVSLAIAGPGVPAGRTIARQVRHVDLAPTMLGLAGIGAPRELDGEDLRSVWAGRTREAPMSYAESRFGEIHFGWRRLTSARDGAWKYIEGATPELYHLATDPAERQDVSASRRDTAAALARELGRIATGRGADAPTRDGDAAARLRSLGYVSGSVDLGPHGGGDPKQEIHRYVEYVDAFNSGLADLEGGRPGAAERRFRDLARAFPRAYEAHQYLGRALVARRAYAQAIAELDAAIALAPREPDVYFDAARALAAAGRVDDAFDRVARGRALDTSSSYGAVTEGLVARAAGQPERAERAFRDALRINPSLAVAHLELGRLAEARGDRSGARVEFQRAVAGDADLVDARRALERVSR